MPVGSFVKSGERVKKYGEVFTPQWMVDLMLNQGGIPEKLKDPYATFLEPAAGNGNFLVAILEKRLGYINQTYDGEERDIKALWGLSNIYGIELMRDNLAEARRNMFSMFLDNYRDFHGNLLDENDKVYKSAKFIIKRNVQQGNTLTGMNDKGTPIIFSHWERIPENDGLVHRVQFCFSDVLAGESLDEDNDSFIEYEIVPIEDVFMGLRK